MALTRPTFQNLNSNLTTFSDSTIVVNFANVANRDLGILFDRSQGSASNVALVWQESTQSFKMGYTSSTGLDSANLTFTSNANLRVGNLYIESISYANGSAFTSSVPGGSNTQLQYNNSGSFAGASGLTTDGTNLSGTGNITASGLTINNSVTVGTTLGVTGNITTGAYFVGNGALLTGIAASSTYSNTNVAAYLPIYGGALNASTITGTANATANALTVNNAATIGSTLGVTGNINGSSITLSGSGVLTNSLRAIGGLQATPIGNASASTGQFTTVSATGNVTGAALTSNASITAITTLSALGGLQATPIGNVTPATALFTTIGASGNTTVAALTVNGTATIGSTLGVTGNLTIGTGTSGNIFGVNNIYANSVIGNANSTIQALTVNTSATFGTTLGVTGNATIGNISGVGRIISTDLTNATGTGTGAFIIVGGGSVTKDFWVGGNLYTTNLIAQTTSNITVQDPLLYLTANTPYPYSYEIGFYSQFDTTGTNYQHTGFIRDHTDNVWKLVSNVTEPTGQTVDFTNANVIYDSIKTGNATVGNLNSLGNVSGSFILGNGSQLTGVSAVTAQYVTGLTSANVTTALSYVPLNSNATALTAQYVTQAAQSNITSVGVLTSLVSSGNLTASGLTINNSGTFGTTLRADGGIQATVIGNATASGGRFTYLHIISGGNLTAGGLTINADATIGTTLSAAGGLQATPIGNATASTGRFTSITVDGGIQSTPIGNTFASTGRFSSINIVSGGNLTAGGLTINADATIGTTLGVTGNITAGNLITSGNASASYYFGNGSQLTGISAATAITAQYVTGLTSANVTTALGYVPLNSNGTAITATTAQYVTGLTGTNVNVALGYIPLNSNSTALTAQYVTQAAQSNITSVGVLTSLVSSGNITTNGLTVNTSAVVGTTLQAAGGLQNTPIGNVTPSSALFTTAGTSSNATVAALTVNGTATIGSTLGVTGNINGSSLTLTGSGTVGTTLGVAGSLNSQFGIISSDRTAITGQTYQLVIKGNGSIGTFAMQTAANGWAEMSVVHPTLNTQMGGFGYGGTSVAYYPNTAYIWSANGIMFSGNGYSASGGTRNMYINSSGIVTVPTGVISTSTSTGALVVTGGVGVSGNVTAGGFVGGPLINGTSNISIPTLNDNIYLTINGSNAVTITSGISSEVFRIKGNGSNPIIIWNASSAAYACLAFGNSTGTEIGGIGIGGTAASYYPNTNYFYGSNGMAFTGNGLGSAPGNRNLYITSAGVVTVPTGFGSTSTSTGAFVVTGGVGISANLYAGGNVFGANFFYSNGTAVGGGGSGTGITYTANTAPPTSGNIKGDQWYNTSTDILYEYQYDGTSYYWVDVTGPAYGQVAIANTSPAVYNGLATNVTTAATLIDSISVTGNTSISYTFSAIDNTNSRFKTSKLDTTNDGTNVYYTEYAVVQSNSSYNVAIITSNISGGQLRIYAQGDSANTYVAFQRTVLGSATTSGYMVAGSSTSDTLSPFLLMGA